MFVLRAPRVAKGTYEGDGFVWTDQGELLTMPVVCDSGLIYRSCGCERSFSGVHTRRGTTRGVVSSEHSKSVYAELETTRSENGLHSVEDDWAAMYRFNLMLRRMEARAGEEVAVRYHRTAAGLEATITITREVK